MNTEKVLNPYSLSAPFRAYLYDEVILVWEKRHIEFAATKFNKKALEIDCGLYVLKLGKLPDVSRRDQDTWSADEFLIFHNNEGRGYECLFKRLRDTFAHGHYEQRRRGWITIRHRYKGQREKAENTRVFGSLKITTLKKLVTFLHVNNMATI